jgi:hypothetical protein
MSNEEAEIAVIKNQIKTIFDYIKDDKTRKNIYIGAICTLLIAAIGANLYIGRKLGKIDIHIDQSFAQIETLNRLSVVVPILEVRLNKEEDNYHQLLRNDAVQDEKIGYLEQVILIERKK